MKATIKYQDFVDALHDIKQVAPRKSTLPIITNIILIAEGNKLTLSATDLDNWMVIECKARVAEHGTIVIPPGQLDALLANITGKEINIITKAHMEEINRDYDELDSDRRAGIPEDQIKKTKKIKKWDFKAVIGQTDIALPAHDRTDFPPFPGIFENCPRIKFSDLSAGIKQVQYARCTESSRPVLENICLQPVKRKMFITAADGHRAAIAPLQAKGKLDQQLVLRPETTNIISRIMPGPIQMQYWKGSKDNSPTMMFTQGKKTLIATTYFGTFPNVTSLMPKKLSRTVVFDREAAMKAIRSMAMVDENIRMVASAGKMKIFTNDGGAIKVNTIIKATGKVALCTKGKHLLEAIGIFKDKVTVKTAKGTGPILFQNGPDIHLVMPVADPDIYPQKSQVIDPKQIISQSPTPAVPIPETREPVTV